MRILYVEDNPANLFLVKRVARMGNHDVVNFIDGEEALRKIDNVKPDLILMDIQLAGGLTGLDVVKQLRADGFDRPIIAVTAYAMVGDKERCLQAGCDDYLPKPIPVSRLVELFQHYQVKTDATATSSDAADAPTVAPAATQTVTVETAVANGQVSPAAGPAVIVNPVAQPDTPAAPAQPAVSTSPEATADKSAPAVADSSEPASPEKPVPAVAASPEVTADKSAPVLAEAAPAAVTTPEAKPEAAPVPVATLEAAKESTPPASPAPQAPVSETAPAQPPVPEKAPVAAESPVAEPEADTAGALSSIPQDKAHPEGEEDTPAAAESAKIAPKSS